MAGGARFQAAHVGDEPPREPGDDREVVDDRPRAARQVAGARVLARPAAPPGRPDLGRDQFGEGAPGRDPAEPCGGRRDPVLDRLPRQALVAERRHAPGAAAALAAERDERLAAQAVPGARGGAARPPGFGPRPGRAAAVQPAAAVPHRRLAAAAAGPGPGPAAQGEPEVARRVAVVEPPGAGRTGWSRREIYHNREIYPTSKNISRTFCGSGPRPESNREPRPHADPKQRAGRSLPFDFVA
jgi:hypothetical protein